MATLSRPVLKVAVEEWVPWTKVLTQADGTVRIEGPMAFLLDILSDNLNFEYELVRPTDRVWGGPSPNGSWNGMLGQLQRREVEFAVGPFGVTDLRETVCDFSNPLYSENNAILMVRPTLQSDVGGFVKPFSGQVWLLTLLSLAVVVAVMTPIVAVEVRLFMSSIRWSLSKSTIWALKIVTQDGSVDVPPFNASRLITAVWLLASLVFMSSYSGILTAMLTVPRVTIPIDSLADLVAQQDLAWRLEKGSMMFQYFKEAEDGVRRKVFMGISGTFQDCWAARQDIASGEYAAICDKTTMKKAMSWDFSTSGKCHLYISRELVYTNAIIAMAFQINSTYRASTNQIILTVKEAGILDYWLSAQITNTSQCLRPPTADRTEGIAALSIEAMGGSFLVLAGGLAAGTAVFLLEVSIPRR